MDKSESSSASPIEVAISKNLETEPVDADVEYSPSSDMDIVAHRELSTSRTKSLFKKQILSHAEQPEKSISKLPLEVHPGPKASIGWVKRLKTGSDSFAIGTQCFNVEDDLTSERVHKLFSRVMNYSRSNSFTLSKCLKEHQQFEKTMVLRNRDFSCESLKESHPWIRRWCHSGQESAHTRARQPVQVLCEPENTKAVPENIEGKLFPSLAAMALVGKVVSNFRPFEFRRRGSSVTWNTEGL